MKTITYRAKTAEGYQDVTIVPSQQILVIRAMQRLSGTVKNRSEYTVEMIRAEIQKFFDYGWTEDQFYPGANGEFWLSDKAIKAIISGAD